MRKGKKSNCSEHIAAFTKEITMNTTIKSTAIAVALAGLFAAQPAAADTLTFGGFANGSVAATISSTTPLLNPRSVAAGGFSMTNTTPSPDVSFQAWCVDIFHTLAWSTNYTLQSGASFYAADSNKANALTHLASQYLSSVTNSATSGAFQLAVWEIVNETGITNPLSYSLSGGNFKATSSAAAQAETWLHGINLAGPVTQTLSVWQQNHAGSTQDLAVFAPVPEPQTYAMMLAGLGLMGFVARRRKQEQDYA